MADGSGRRWVARAEQGADLGPSGVEVGDVALDGAARPAEHEAGGGHRQPGGDGQRLGVGGELEAVPPQLLIDCGLVGHRIGLVVDDDEAVGALVEQVDVAFHGPGAHGSRDVRLAPEVPSGEGGAHR